MRIGIVTDCIDRQGYGSGVFLHRICEQLIEIASGHDFYFFHYERNAMEIYRRVTEVILPRSPFAASRILATNNLDVVHYGGMGPLAPIWLDRVPKIATIYGGAELVLDRRFASRKNGFLKRYLRPLMLKRMQAVLTVSDSSKKILIRNGIPEEKLVVIYGGVGPEFKVLPQGNAAGVLERYGIRKRFLLHLSRYVPRKNPKPMLEAFSRLAHRDEYNLVVCGKGWDHPDVSRLLGELGIERDVIMTGYVGTADLVELLNAAELFVFPSVYEGFGIPNIEAMACGTPVISTNVFSIPEVVGDAALLIDDPHDTAELLAAMEKLLSDEPLRQTLIDRGLRRVQKFSWTRGAKKVLETYEKVSAP